MISGLLAGDEDRAGRVYFAVSAAEEMMELGGLILFVHVMLGYLAARVSSIEVRLMAPGQPGGGASTSTEGPVVE